MTNAGVQKQSYFLKEYVPKRIIWVIVGGFGVFELFMYGYQAASALLAVAVLLAATTHYRYETNKVTQEHATYISVLGFCFLTGTCQGVAEFIGVHKKKSVDGRYHASIRISNDIDLVLLNEEDKKELIRKMHKLGRALNLEVFDFSK